MNQHLPRSKIHRKRVPIKESSIKRQAQAQRINRILSAAGLVSRRQADELIRAGRVMLNGRTVKQLGTCAIWGVDNIKVNGQEIPKPFERIYLMLNKPFGYISTLNDPANRPIVTDLLKDIDQRVYPVGRLDFDTIGLLLLTNDGEWSYRLTHPRYHVPRTYKVTVSGNMDETIMNLLRKGVQLEDGFSRPSKITLLRKDKRRTVIRLTITSGRSRLVRRMMEAVGYRVVQLLRTGFGCLALGNLKVGDYRYLEAEEVQTMKKMVGLG